MVRSVLPQFLNLASADWTHFGAATAEAVARGRALMAQPTACSQSESAARQ